MAENSAQSKLGELFVDLGAKGGEGLIKTLGKVSVGMVLGSKTAEALTSNIMNLSKEGGATVTAFDKINAVTGVSIQQLQDLKVWSELNNVSFNELTGQLANVQQNLLKIKTGLGGNIKGFTLLGIDPRSLDYKKPMDALDKIKERVKQVDEATGALALTELGLSADLQYAFRQENENFNKRLLLNTQEVEHLRKQQALWNTLSATWNTAQQKFIANQTWINGLLQKSADFIANLGTVSLNTFSITNEGIGKFLTNIGLKMAHLARKIMVDWNPILAIMDYVHYLFTGKSSELIAQNKEKMNELLDDAGQWFEKYRPQEFKTNNSKKSALKAPIKSQNNSNAENNIAPFKKEFDSYTDAATPSYLLPEVPKPNINSVNSTSHNSITMYIQGNNAKDIATEVNHKLSDTLDFNVVQQQAEWGL